MAKVKLIRDYDGQKKGSTIEVSEKEKHFLLTNTFAVLSGCDSDCEDCEDCKGEKKRRSRKVVKKTKAPTKKK